MATHLTTYEQVPYFDPYNPNQVIREQYAQIPGGYGSWYFNKIPTTAKSMNGASLGLSPADIPSWLQMLIVAGAGAAVGYFGWSKFGGKIKSKLGLTGHHRRRRR